MEPDQAPRPRIFSRHFFHVVTVFLVIIAAPAMYVYWAGRPVQGTIQETGTEEDYRQYRNETEKYEDTLRADTYGGASPEETLSLFIKALAASDAALASKYFEPPEAKQEEWRAKLAAQQAILPRLAAELEKYDELKQLTPATSLFIYKNADGSVGLQLSMRYIPLSKLWKIEGL